MTVNVFVPWYEIMKIKYILFPDMKSKCSIFVSKQQQQQQNKKQKLFIQWIKFEISPSFLDIIFIFTIK